jgi:AcrR family transcriptional regulator
VRDIASAARIRVSTLYHYFTSKEALYAAVQARVHDQMRDITVGVLSRDLEFADTVRECVGQHFDFFLANPAYVRLSLRACIDDDGGRLVEQRAVDRWLGFTEGALRPAQARGLIRRVDPVLLMMTMEALLHWFIANQAVYRHLTGKGYDDPAAARRAREHIVEVAIATLGVDSVRG